MTETDNNKVYPQGQNTDPNQLRLFSQPQRYPEMIVNSEPPPELKALISAYEGHIETLKSRIKELELLVLGRPDINSVSLVPTNPPRPVIRTSSQLIKALEELSARNKQAKLDMNKEVRESDVK